MLKVAKFGGSSMADAVQIRKVCAIIRSDESWSPPRASGARMTTK